VRADSLNLSASENVFSGVQTCEALWENTSTTVPTKRSPQKTASKTHLYMVEKQLAERFGWTSTPASRDAVISYIKSKAEKLGFDEISYYNTVLKSEAELFTLVDEVADCNTRFFRDPKQFACIRDHVIPELIKSNKASKQLRIWSVACSTGEESYSMAVVCREKLKRMDGWQVEILGTDLCSKALMAANMATYAPASLRNVSDEERQKFFVPVAESSTLQLKPEIKRMASFRRGNVIEPAFWRQIKKGYDFIICSNLLSGLNSQAATQVVKRVHDALRPGGFLMVGSSEKAFVIGPAFKSIEAPGLFQKTDSD